MNIRHSLPSRIRTPSSRRMGAFTLNIYETGSSVFVDVLHHAGFDSSLLASMEIKHNVPIIISRFSGSKVALVEQLEMEIVHVPRVRL